MSFEIPFYYSNFGEYIDNFFAPFNPLSDISTLPFLTTIELLSSYTTPVVKTNHQYL